MSNEAPQEKPTQAERQMRDLLYLNPACDSILCWCALGVCDDVPRNAKIVVCDTCGLIMLSSSLARCLQPLLKGTTP